jgi:hypothetical protein
MNIDFSPDFLSTLADPTWGAIFANENVAGNIAESLTKAVVSDIIGSFGKIRKVVPQSRSGLPGDRGSRVDIEVVTDANEIVIYELQVLYDRAMPKRNILAASHRIFDSVAPGIPIAELPERIPKIILINILCYNVRDDNTDIVQPSRTLYTKAPNTVADDTITRFDVQLPRFLKLVEDNKVDYKNALHCWLMLFWKSHELRKKPEEVLRMYPQLKEFAEANTGYGDYCRRYNLVAGDRGTLSQYAMWLSDAISYQSVIDSAREDEALKWEGVLAEALADKDAALADKDAEIAALKARLEQ